MDAKLLVKQFGADPGVAFVEIIRSAARPISAREVKNDLVEAGVARTDVDRKWKQLQPYVKLHPHVQKSGATRYEWSVEPRPSAESLEVLSSTVPKRVPGWFVQALVANIADSLAVAETSGGHARSSWTRQREWEKVKLLADIATAVQGLRAEGGGIVDAADWLAGEAERRRLRPVAVPGESVAFDPDRHEPVTGSRPLRGAAVTVVGSGYVWHGGEGPVVVVKAAVTG